VPLPDSTWHLVLPVDAFLRRLAARVPPPGSNLVRFHGLFAPGAALRPRVVPKSEAPAPISESRFTIRLCMTPVRCGTHKAWQPFSQGEGLHPGLPPAGSHARQGRSLQAGASKGVGCRYTGCTAVTCARFALQEGRSAQLARGGHGGQSRWVQPTMSLKDCEDGYYVHQGACYGPVFPPARPSTSGPTKRSGDAAP
jgi:hypothetical protein